MEGTDNQQAEGDSRLHLPVVTRIICETEISQAVRAAGNFVERFCTPAFVKRAEFPAHERAKRFHGYSSTASLRYAVDRASRRAGKEKS